MNNFEVECEGSSYTVYGHEWSTHEMVWRCEMCWFVEGAIVTITDSKGNRKTFMKGGIYDGVIEIKEENHDN